MAVSRSWSAEADTRGTKMGPFWLTPATTRLNGITLLYSGFSVIGLMTFMGFAQPFILQEILQIPEDKQGSLIGLLSSMQEGIYILTVGFFGALSDKLGRRIVYVAGVCVLAVGFFIYPLAGSIPELVAFRFIYAIGFSAAAVMLHTCIAEYSQDVTRGKWMGLVGFLNGIGVVLMATVLTKMPTWFGAMGFDEAAAIRLSMWSMGAYFALLAILLRIGLKSPKAEDYKPKENVFVLLGKGFAAARENPRIALAYGMAFASRGDLAVLTAFFSLWLVQSGTEQGMSLSESTARAGMLFGFSQGISLLWGLTMGVILDKMNRMNGMCLAFALAALGYFSLGQISDPFGSLMLLACVLVGIGEAAAIVSGGVLIGQEAPGKVRGVVLGTYSLVGGIGMLVIVFAGGYLFDLVGKTAPFIMMGFINLAVFIAAMLMRFVIEPAAARDGALASGKED